jgi:hypothetical protein
MPIGAEGWQMSVRTVRTQRGVPLTVMLVLLTLAQLWVVVFGFRIWQSNVAHNQGNPGLALTGTLLGIVGLVAFIGVWLWRKLAVYLLAAVVLVGLVTDAIYGLSSISLLIRLALLAALAWCIKQKWQSFR